MPTLRDHIVEVVNAGLREDLKFSFPGESARFNVPDTYHAMLSGLSSLQRNNGKVINLGNMRSTLNIYNVGEALVRRALDEGVESSVDALFKFIEQDYNPCIEVVLLRGIKVPRTFKLLDNVFIASPDSVPSTSLKIFLKENSEKQETFDFMSPTLPVDYTPSAGKPDSVLYRLTSVRPKFFDHDDPACQMFDLDEMNYLKHISELLTIISPSIVINRRSYSELQEGSFLYGVTGRSWQSKYQEAGIGQVHDVTLDELEEFKKTLALYFALPKAKREKLEVPIHRINEAARHDNLVDRAIDLGVAMESLLLAGLEDTAQLSLTLRLRGAWLLGRDFTERKDIYYLLRDLYDCRSSAAHSGKLSKRTKDEARAEIALKDGLPLCARAIKEVIFRGGELTPNFWVELMLGGGK
ncbi:HEPN domain-containing protein [Pseudomonas mandelii]|uniref:Apea-like HEPN domain-containing protein n=1 Tax=Pseudomonas mandelii TaxID=75612 RepID=A0ABY0VUR5_9PSED|nr:HEPN domain-containing protein [Pseudomonas mandelii]TWS08742.1 hypothetical protein FJD35_19925 [Pseudomonas mandelii]SDU56874.1 hypothetical protein SAMN04489801_4521 [Pseudomonas mandelii]